MSAGDLIQNGVATFYATIEMKDFVRKTFSNYLHQYYDAGFELKNDTNLFELGFVDSLTGVEIIMKIEEEFNISFNDGDAQSIIHNCSIDNVYNVLIQYITPSDK